MIINLINKKDLITLDLRIKQIRFLKDFEKRGNIEFINLSNTDIEAYEYLFKEDKNLFINTIKEDILSFLGIELNDLRFLK